MAIRLIVSIFVVSIGLASPWLVKDWLQFTDENRLERYESQMVTLAAAAAPIRGARLAAPAIQEKRPVRRLEAGQGIVQAPMPAASKTMRIVQSIVPRTLSAKSTTAISLLKGDGIPSSKVARDAAARKKSTIDASMSRLGLKRGGEIFLRAFKEEKELELWVKGGKYNQFTLFRIYKISEWSGNKGPKLREGDGQTPEGFYYVPASRLRPNTRHHLGFDIGYPNAYDQYHNRTGSDILIHGSGTSQGSLVLSNSSMEEVYTLAEAAIRGGQRYFRVNIFPFRMSDKRMDQVWADQGKWTKFWVNLKEGYDFFENVGYPPDVGVTAGKYSFSLH